MKQKLTIEQSAELIKRGVASEKASIYHNGSGFNDIGFGFVFTLTDLLLLLPKEAKYDSLGRPYTLHIEISNNFARANYIQNASLIGGCGKLETELIDTLYDLVLWCLDKNIKLN